MSVMKKVKNLNNIMIGLILIISKLIINKDNIHFLYTLMTLKMEA